MQRSTKVQEYFIVNQINEQLQVFKRVLECQIRKIAQVTEFRRVLGKIRGRN